MQLFKTVRERVGTRYREEVLVACGGAEIVELDAVEKRRYRVQSICDLSVAERWKGLDSPERQVQVDVG